MKEGVTARGDCMRGDDLVRSINLGVLRRKYMTPMFSSAGQYIAIVLRAPPVGSLVMAEMLHCQVWMYLRTRVIIGIGDFPA